MEKISNKIINLLPLKNYSRLKDRSKTTQPGHKKPIKKFSVHTPSKMCPASTRNCMECMRPKGNKSLDKCKGNRKFNASLSLKETD